MPSSFQLPAGLPMPPLGACGSHVELGSKSTFASSKNVRTYPYVEDTKIGSHIITSCSVSIPFPALVPHRHRHRHPLPPPRRQERRASRPSIGAVCSAAGGCDTMRPRLATIAHPCTFFSSTRRFFGSVSEKDQICELAASNIRFGAGSTSEIGDDLTEMQARKVIVFVDPNISRQSLPCLHTLLDSLSRNKLNVHVYDEVRVEPSEQSFQHAIDFMSNLHSSVGLDAVVALGGGSTIDTAKAANLYTCHPPSDGDFYTYVNPVVGKGQPIPGPLLPWNWQ